MRVLNFKDIDDASKEFVLYTFNTQFVVSQVKVLYNHTKL